MPDVDNVPAEPARAPTLAEVETEYGPASIADTMRSLADKNGWADDEPIAPATEQEPAAEKVEAEDGRQRDEKGRFVAREKDDDAPDDTAEPGAAEVEAGSEPQEADAEPETDFEPAPEWTAEQHEKFRNADPVLKKLMLDQREMANEGREAVQRFSQIESIIAPHRQNWAMRGLDDAGAIRQIFSTVDFMAKKPAEFAQWFLAQNNLTVESDQPQQPEFTGEEQYEDPQMQALYQRNQQLESQLQQTLQRIDNLEGTFQYQNVRSQEAEQQRLRNEVEAFKAEAGPNGRPAHPYFDQVRPYMAALLRSDQNLGLKEAYDRACWANPDIRAKITQAEKAAAERERAQRDREHAAAARRAGSSVTGQPGDTAMPALTGKSIRDQVALLAQEKGFI